MRKSFDFYIISLLVLCVAGLMCFTGHSSNILIDVGREVYYPEQILNNQVLYKDIFNIYGALAYQINALLYLIFGAKLQTLYLSGGICSILAVCGIYLISREFLPKFSSFVIGLFTISVGVLTTTIFNYHFPYSWAVLYGMVSFLYSLYFLIRYDKTKNPDFLCYSAFLGGMCVAFKYDFLLYSFVILYFTIKNKNLKAFLSFLSAPLISLAGLFLQGLSLNDIINSLNIYALMAKSQTLKYFYQNSGIYFHPKSLPTDFILFLKSLIPFALMLFVLKKFEKRRILRVFGLFFCMTAVFVWFGFTKFYALGFLPVLLLILTVIRFKTLKSEQIILAVSALLVSAKVFWVMLLGSYANYYAPIIVLSLAVVLLNAFLKQKVMQSIICTVLFLSIAIMFQNIWVYKYTGYEIQTPKGRIYTTHDTASSTNELIDYFKTAPEGDVLIFPEGLTVNFLTDRKSDSYYNSLLPLYAETFRESDIVEHFKTTKPEYIVLNNLDMKDYYFRFICQDYALEFCGFVRENYRHETTFGDKFRYLVFKRKQTKGTKALGY